MIKLHIINMKNFLNAVNSCLGKVYLLSPDGEKVNICREETAQNNLWNQYRQNKNYLRLALEIPEPKDYMNVVLSYIGNY